MLEIVYFFWKIVEAYLPPPLTKMVGSTSSQANLLKPCIHSLVTIEVPHNGLQQVEHDTLHRGAYRLHHLSCQPCKQQRLMSKA